MARYHITAAGEPRPCRASKRPCPLGGAADHYPTKAAALAGYEQVQELELARTLQGSAPAGVAEPALSSPLGTGLPTPLPAWVATAEAEASRQGKPAPELLLAYETPFGLAVASWEEESLKERDSFLREERGFELHRVTLRSAETGELMGSVQVSYSSLEAQQHSWGSDEWASQRYCAEYLGGRSFGLPYGDDGSLKRYSPLERATTAEELLQAKQEVWAGIFKGLEEVPPAFDTSQLTWGSLVNLKASHAPSTHEELDEQLAVGRTLMDERLQEFRENHADPIIDYASVEDPYRGHALATSLYVLAARKLGQRGLSLHASGLQTPAAQKAWLRMARDPRLPVEVTTRVYRKGASETHKPGYSLAYGSPEDS